MQSYDCCHLLWTAGSTFRCPIAGDDAAAGNSRQRVLDEGCTPQRMGTTAVSDVVAVVAVVLGSQSMGIVVRGVASIAVAVLTNWWCDGEAADTDRNRTADVPSTNLGVVLHTLPAGIECCLGSVLPVGTSAVGALPTNGV